MEYLRRRVKQPDGTYKWHSFKIYKEKEAEKEGIPFKYWKEVEEPGWVLTDDGYVGELLKVNETQSRQKSRFFKYSFAGRFERDKSPLLWEERRESGNFSGSTPQKWIVAEMKSRRFKDVVRTYVTMMLNGKVDWHQLGVVYRPDSVNPSRTAKKLFKEEKVQEAVTKQLADKLAEKEITEEWVIDQYKEVADRARNSGKFDPWLKTLDKLAGLLGMNNKITVKMEEQINYDKMLDNLERKGKLTVTKENQNVNDLQSDM